LKILKSSSPNQYLYQLIRGTFVTFVILLASSTTSPKLVIPKSGIPKDALATPAPDKLD
jgi:hypothetical protein